MGPGPGRGARGREGRGRTRGGHERGRDYDDGEGGSGLPHVALIMSSALMLTASVIRGIGQDDRLPAVDENAMTAKEAAKWIQKTLDDANKIMNGEAL